MGYIDTKLLQLRLLLTSWVLGLLLVYASTRCRLNHARHLRDILWQSRVIEGPLYLENLFWELFDHLTRGAAHRFQSLATFCDDSGHASKWQADRWPPPAWSLCGHHDIPCAVFLFNRVIVYIWSRSTQSPPSAPVMNYHGADLS